MAHLNQNEEPLGATELKKEELSELARMTTATRANDKLYHHDGCGNGEEI